MAGDAANASRPVASCCRPPLSSYSHSTGGCKPSSAAALRQSVTSSLCPDSSSSGAIVSAAAPQRLYDLCRRLRIGPRHVHISELPCTAAFTHRYRQLLLHRADASSSFFGGCRNAPSSSLCFPMATAAAADVSPSEQYYMHVMYVHGWRRRHDAVSSRSEVMFPIHTENCTPDDNVLDGRDEDSLFIDERRCTEIGRCPLCAHCGDRERAGAQGSQSKLHSGEESHHDCDTDTTLCWLLFVHAEGVDNHDRPHHRRDTDGSGRSKPFGECVLTVPDIHAFHRLCAPASLVALDPEEDDGGGVAAAPPILFQRVETQSTWLGHVDVRFPEDGLRRCWQRHAKLRCQKDNTLWTAAQGHEGNHPAVQPRLRLEVNEYLNGVFSVFSKCDNFSDDEEEGNHRLIARSDSGGGHHCDENVQTQSRSHSMQDSGAETPTSHPVAEKPRDIAAAYSTTMVTVAAIYCHGASVPCETAVAADPTADIGTSIIAEPQLSELVTWLTGVSRLLAVVQLETCPVNSRDQERIDETVLLHASTELLRSLGLPHSTFPRSAAPLSHFPLSSSSPCEEQAEFVTADVGASATIRKAIQAAQSLWSVWWPPSSRADDRTSKRGAGVFHKSRGHGDHHRGTTSRDHDGDDEHRLASSSLFDGDCGAFLKTVANALVEVPPIAAGHAPCSSSDPASVNSLVAVIENTATGNGQQGYGRGASQSSRAKKQRPKPMACHSPALCALAMTIAATIVKIYSFFVKEQVEERRPTGLDNDGISPEIALAMLQRCRQILDTDAIVDLLMSRMYAAQGVAGEPGGLSHPPLSEMSCPAQVLSSHDVNQILPGIRSPCPAPPLGRHHRSRGARHGVHINRFASVSVIPCRGNSYLSSPGSAEASGNAATSSTLFSAAWLRHDPDLLKGANLFVPRTIACLLDWTTQLRHRGHEGPPLNQHHGSPQDSLLLGVLELLITPWTILPWLASRQRAGSGACAQLWNLAGGSLVPAVGVWAICGHEHRQERVPGGHHNHLPHWREQLLMSLGGPSTDVFMSDSADLLRQLPSLDTSAQDDPRRVKPQENLTEVVSVGDDDATWPSVTLVVNVIPPRPRDAVLRREGTRLPMRRKSEGLLVPNRSQAMTVASSPPSELLPSSRCYPIMSECADRALRKLVHNHPLALLQVTGVTAKSSSSTSAAAGSATDGARRRPSAVWQPDALTAAAIPACADAVARIVCASQNGTFRKEVCELLGFDDTADLTAIQMPPLRWGDTERRNQQLFVAVVAGVQRALIARWGG